MRFNANLLGVTFCFLLMTHFADAIILDRIAAVVNNDVITQSEIYAAEELNLHLSGLPRRDTLLEERIDHHLLQQQLAKQPPVQVDEEIITAALDEFVNNHDGKESTTKFLSSIGLTDLDLETEIKEEITARQFITFRFRPFVDISLDQAEKYYQDVYSPRLRSRGTEPSSFADSFDTIQNELIQSQIQERLTAWLQELRNSSNITVKN